MVTLVADVILAVGLSALGYYVLWLHDRIHAMELRLQAQQHINENIIRKIGPVVDEGKSPSTEAKGE